MKGRFTETGGLSVSDFHKAQIKQYAKENPGQPFEIKPILPESQKLRGYFEGSIVGAMTYYQEGMDHRNSKDCDQVREWLKQELNGELCEIGGKVHRIAMSTKSNLREFVERCVAYMEENYEMPPEVLDSNKYKQWRDTIYPFLDKAKSDNYIDYLVEIGILKSNIPN